MTTENTKPGRGYIYVEMTIKDPQGFKDCAHRAGGRTALHCVRIVS